MRKLLQIHWQFKNREETEFVAQKEITSHKDLKFWLDELWITHPPPDGCWFVVHTEESPYFVKTKA